MRIALSAAVVALSAALLQGCGCRDDNVNADIDPVDPLEGDDIGSWLSMTLDPQGRPAISFYDRTQGALGFACGTFDDDGEISWDNEKVDGFAGSDGLDPGDRGTYTSLAFDASGTPWIAYQDANNKVLYVARRLGHSDWETTMVAVGGGVTSDAGYYTSLAFDSADSPVIAYYDQGVGELKVAHMSGGAWTATTVDAGEDYVAADTGEEDVDADVGKYTSMLIDGSTEYIAYYDVAWGDLKLAVGAAGSYTVYTIDSDGDVGGWPSLAAFEGDLVITYEDLGNGNLKVARGAGNSWDVKTIDTSERVGADSHLFVKDGELHVIYFDAYNNDLKKASTTAGVWGPAEVVAEDGALGYHNEVVEIDGTAYAACYDYTDRGLWFSAL